MLTVVYIKLDYGEQVGHGEALFVNAMTMAVSANLDRETVKGAAIPKCRILVVDMECDSPQMMIMEPAGGGTIPFNRIPTDDDLGHYLVIHQGTTIFITDPDIITTEWLRLQIEKSNALLQRYK